MLQDTAAAVHSIERGFEASAVCAWAVVFATVTGVVCFAHVAPSLARRMCHDRRVTGVGSRIAGFIVAVESKRFVVRVRHHEQNHGV
jgi:hypothetical protein